MNIEEDDLGEAIRAAGDYLAHVHLADSSRLQPGTAHTDFAGVLAALRETGFEGYMAMECGIRGDAEEAIPETVRYLRSLMG
jgi:sugar phosphate isomerase/epimerase